MVFTRLAETEKHAFFDLLDEYFASRPELLANLNGSAAAGTNQDATPSGRAASAVHNALASNPEATASLISAGLRHSAQASSASGGRSPAANSAAQAAANPQVANAIGRVGAAALAFNAGHKPPPPAAPPSRSPMPPARSPVPPALPRRTSSPSSDSTVPERPPMVKGNSTEKLKQGRSFGDVDTTSFGRAFMSIKNGTANKSKAPPAVAPPIPSAFPKKPNNFAPPPRRVTSDSSAASVSPQPPFRQLQPEPEPEEAEEEEEEGEWAEALYDYTSAEADDLEIRANERIKIINRDSDDWWKGEVNGKSGLFPASYVKLL